MPHYGHFVLTVPGRWSCRKEGDTYRTVQLALGPQLKQDMSPTGVGAPL
jgi:hypothetical protein